MHGGVIDAQAALGHHLFQIAQAEIVGQVPANTQHDHRLIEMAALNMAGSSMLRRLPCLTALTETFATEPLAILLALSLMLIMRA